MRSFNQLELCRRWFLLYFKDFTFTRLSIEASYADRAEKLRFDSILSSDAVGFKIFLKTKVLAEVYLEDTRVCYKCKIEDNDSSVLKTAKLSFTKIMERLEMKLGQISNKLPKGSKTIDVDYGCFSNPESVKKFDETTDYSEFDFNEFLRSNAEFMRATVNFLTIETNRTRSEYNAKNFNHDEQDNEEKYLVNFCKLFQLGKNRAFSQLEDGIDFNINDNHKRLLQEMAECSSSLSYENKPLVIQAISTMNYLSAEISKKSENFPRHTNNGLKREMRETLTELKKAMSKLVIRGSNDTSIYSINEKILMLRFCINEAHVLHYFNKGEDKNNKVAYYLASLVTRIGDLVNLMKKCSKKTEKK